MGICPSCYIIKSNNSNNNNNDENFIEIENGENYENIIISNNNDNNNDDSNKKNDNNNINNIIIPKLESHNKKDKFKFLNNYKKGLTTEMFMRVNTNKSKKKKVKFLITQKHENNNLNVNYNNKNKQFSRASTNMNSILYKQFNIEEISLVNQLNNNLKFLNTKNSNDYNKQKNSKNKNNENENNNNENENNENDNNNNNENINQKNPNFSNSSIIKISEETLFKISEYVVFKNNFEFNEEFKFFLGENITEYEIEQEMYLFQEGEMASTVFIIKNGVIQIFDKANDKSLILNNNNIFGGISLISNDVIRRFSAKSLTKVNFYAFERENFFEYLKKKNREIFSIDVNILKQIQIFKYIHNEDLIFLARMCFIINDIKSFNILNNSNKMSNNEINFIEISEFFRIDVNYFYEKTYIQIELGILNLNENFYKNKNYNENSFLIIPLTSLLENFGIDYKSEILYSIYSSQIKFCETFNKITNNNLNYKSFFDLFHLRKMKKNNIINLSNQKTIFFLLTGKCILSNTNNTSIRKINNISLFDTNKFKSNVNCLFSNTSIIFECNIDDLKKKVKELNSKYNKALTKYSKIMFLNLLNDEEFVNISSMINEKEYKKDELIFKSDETVNNFYIVINGVIELRSPKDNKIIQIYTKGNTFGEKFLLSEIEFYDDEIIQNNLGIKLHSYSIVTSNKAIVYEISKESFYNLLQNPKLNDFIKNKICLEDKTIILDDLYYISNLGKGKYGNVSLVHNTISLYAIKCISKIAAEKQIKGVKFLLNEKNVLMSLNHPFIIKLVKTLKNKFCCFFLMEYSTGKTLDEVLKSLNKKYNSDITKFYGGSLFLIIKYLHKMGFIHRDIKPNNIMIDLEGYVKLVDFGASKKIDRKFTKTIIGTPLYMAPEILEGKEYNYSCDYFSIGVCIYLIYFGFYPFGNGLNDPYKIYKEILSKKISFDNNLPQNFDLNNLIKFLLVKNPNDRIGNFKIIKNHNFFNGFDWNKLFCKKIIPPYIPNNKYNDAWLQNTNTPFLNYLESEKTVDSINKISSRIEMENKEINNNNNKNWFDDF